MKRASLAIALSALLALSSPAWAQGPGNGNGNGNGSSENGNGRGPADNPGQGGDHGRDNAGAPNPAGVVPPGLADPKGIAPGQANAAPPAAAELSESDALAAVEAGRAVELETLLPDIRSRTGGEVINAQLLQVGGFLIYAVTALTPAGQVITEHYYARSGVHVGQ